MNVDCVTQGATTFTANAYLVEGDETVLVDAGAMAGVEDVIADRVDTLDSVRITHQDRDHVAQLGAVVDAFDPTVYAFAPTRVETTLLSDGDEVQFGGERFEALHTPGHADDHLAFVGERTLFSGDLVVYNDQAFDDGSFGKTEKPDQDREVLIESIRTLLDRLPDTVEHLYAGHGDPFHGDVETVIERALSRAERREPKYPEG